jgi:hypothetical protein
MLREDVQHEWFIWRAILAGHCTISEVKSNLVTVSDLKRLNALMDAQDYLRS